MILGIDPGSIKAGYAVMSDDGLELHEFGVLKLCKADPLLERMDALRKDIEGLFAEYGPTTMAIEQAYVDRDPHAALVLGEVRGLCKCIGLAAGIRILEFAPSTVKARVAGNGRASKQLVRNTVKARFSIAGEPGLDASDAVAIALCGALELSRTRTASRDRTPSQIRRSPNR
jgi:crossover junction endodeoxyribonuclease RuvC